jgi:hypothetical protein
LPADTKDHQRLRIIPNPRYCGNADQQVCDVIVQCGSIAIFIEIKGNTITSEAKYGGDLDLLNGDLKKKWVGGSDEKRGVTQLVPAINETCADEARDV